MKQSRIRGVICVGLAFTVVGFVFLPSAYERHVTGELARALDTQHGKAGWAVLWRTADGQSGESIALYRTLYVRLFSPRLQEFTPWKGLHFTHKTTASIRPWHYAVCIISEGGQITYFWSIAQRRWISAWSNDTHQFPADVQRDYVSKLSHVVRQNGLNWPG